jgi:cation transport regulator ChaC
MIKPRRVFRVLRPVIAGSWALSRFYYRWHGIRLTGRPDEEVWYFAFGANMHDSAFRERRGMRPIEWRPGRIEGHRLRFNLDGRPKGKAAPANISPDPDAEVWGVLYRITRADLLRLDRTEGVPGRRYRHLWVDGEDIDGTALRIVTYIADGNERDGNPSLRYITLLREGARAHGLPEPYLRFLDGVENAK